MYRNLNTKFIGILGSCCTTIWLCADFNRPKNSSSSSSLLDTFSIVLTGKASLLSSPLDTLSSSSEDQTHSPVTVLCKRPDVPGCLFEA